MNKTIVKLGVLSLLTGALVATQVQVRAQDNANPSIEQNEGKSRKSGVVPFHGKLKAVDTAADTIAVGSKTYHITPDTKLFKSDQPATLQDAVVGETVSGAYRKAADGRLLATKVTFGPKPAKQGKSKKVEEAEEN